MIYRYKLARTQRTININSKVLEGVKLRKHAWLYSMDQLNFAGSKDLVVEEMGDSKELLLQADKIKKKERYEKQKEIGRNKIAYKKRNIQEIVNALTINELNEKTDYQLKAILHYLKFKKHEFINLDKEGLISLILLEKEVGNGKAKKSAKKNK